MASLLREGGAENLRSWLQGVDWVLSLLPNPLLQTRLLLDPLRPMVRICA